jgi:hypothetical protein
LTTDFLNHIEFPASKQDVIAVAAEGEASQEVLDALQRTEQERFEDRAAVERALGSPGR